MPKKVLKCQVPSTWDAKRFKRLREELGWSMNKMGRELGYVQSGRGTASHVLGIESGAREIIGPVARLLDVLEQHGEIPTTQNRNKI